MNLQFQKMKTLVNSYTRLKFQAALSTNTFLNKLINNTLTYISQDKSKVTFAPSLKEDGYIDFQQ